MQIKTRDKDGDLESYRPSGGTLRWKTAISGYWSQGSYHSGYILYAIARVSTGQWVMQSEERNAQLDSVTEEDIEEGALTDDQLQAMLGMTLDEAQNQVYREIVAVCTDAPARASYREMAGILYGQVCKDGGKKVKECDEGDYLLSTRS